MTITTKIAEMQDLPKVVKLYQDICDHQSEDEYGADWTWGDYPSETGLKHLIETADFVIGLQDNKVVAAGVITIGDDYPMVDWPTKAAGHQIGVLHLLGVHPQYRGQGIARQILKAALKAAKDAGLKVVHLDVLKGNVPAEKLYENNGFKVVERLILHYDDIGDQAATVMECVL